MNIEREVQVPGNKRKVSFQDFNLKDSVFRKVDKNHVKKVYASNQEDIFNKAAQKKEDDEGSEKAYFGEVLCVRTVHEKNDIQPT